MKLTYALLVQFDHNITLRPIKHLTNRRADLPELRPLEPPLDGTCGGRVVRIAQLGFDDRRGHFTRRVDNLLDSWDAQRHVHRRDAREVERLQRHLRARLSDGLRADRSNGRAGLDALCAVLFQARGEEVLHLRARELLQVGAVRHKAIRRLKRGSRIGSRGSFRLGLGRGVRLRLPSGLLILLLLILIILNDTLLLASPRPSRRPSNTPARRLTAAVLAHNRRVDRRSTLRLLLRRRLCRLRLLDPNLLIDRFILWSRIDTLHPRLRLRQILDKLAQVLLVPARLLSQCPAYQLLELIAMAM